MTIAQGRRVRDVMTSPAVTVPSSATLQDVVTTLLERSISSVPVTDPSGRLVGVVSEADLLSRPAYGSGRSQPLLLVAQYLAGIDPQWPRKAEGLIARDVMTHDVATIGPAADLRLAARKMLEHRVKSLVVVDREAIVGVIARRDVLGALDGVDHRSASEPEPSPR